MKYFILLLLMMVTVQATERPPNIVFILADDLGITDIGAYARHFTGAKENDLFFETPHLDKLVADGIAFSQAYANQLCSPTRAAILTGRIASRMGVTTATPNTRTYFNQGIKAPEGYACRSGTRTSLRRLPADPSHSVICAKRFHLPTHSHS